MRYAQGDVSFIHANSITSYRLSRLLLTAHGVYLRGSALVFPVQSSDKMGALRVLAIMRQRPCRKSF